MERDITTWRDGTPATMQRQTGTLAQAGEYIAVALSEARARVEAPDLRASSLTSSSCRIRPRCQPRGESRGTRSTRNRAAEGRGGQARQTWRLGGKHPTRAGVGK